MPVLGVFLASIQSECEKKQTRKTPNTDAFHAVVLSTMHLCNNGLWHLLKDDYWYIYEQNRINFRNIFGTLTNINDGVSLRKQLMDFTRYLFSQKKPRCVCLTRSELLSTTYLSIQYEFEMMTGQKIKGTLLSFLQKNCSRKITDLEIFLWQKSIFLFENSQPITYFDYFPKYLDRPSFENLPHF